MLLWRYLPLCSAAFALLSPPLSAQQSQGLTVWEEVSSSQATPHDEIASSISLSKGSAQLTLACVRSDANNHVKEKSSLRIGIDLTSTQFDIATRNIPYQYQAYDLCPISSPTPSNPYNVTPMPCNWRWETRYEIERSIMIEEKVGRDKGQWLKIAAPQERNVDVALDRDLSFLTSGLYSYSFSSDGRGHVLQFSTHAPAVRAFIDRCAAPSEEQTRFLKDLEDRKLATARAEEQERAQNTLRSAASAAASTRYYQAQAYLGLDHDAQRNRGEGMVLNGRTFDYHYLLTETAISAYQFFAEPNSANIEVKQDGTFDPKLFYPYSVKLKAKVSIPAGTSCVFDPAGANVTMVDGERYAIAYCSEKWGPMRPDFGTPYFDPSTEVLIPAVTVRDQMS